MLYHNFNVYAIIWFMSYIRPELGIQTEYLGTLGALVDGARGLDYDYLSASVYITGVGGGHDATYHFADGQPHTAKLTGQTWDVASTAEVNHNDFPETIEPLLDEVMVLGGIALGQAEAGRDTPYYYGAQHVITAGVSRHLLPNFVAGEPSYEVTNVHTVSHPLSGVPSAASVTIRPHSLAPVVTTSIQEIGGEITAQQVVAYLDDPLKLRLDHLAAGLILPGLDSGVRLSTYSAGLDAMNGRLAGVRALDALLDMKEVGHSTHYQQLIKALNARHTLISPIVPKRQPLTSPPLQQLRRYHSILQRHASPQRLRQHLIAAAGLFAFADFFMHCRQHSQELLLLLVT